ncbi:hypothetical protein SAVCW2_10800 [Streptomyces avermitilis]|uniref:Uncharacterized protein n=1 Tax=Streptomyces avermitilis TaxID=33903 RepID=A0A499W7A1_STRAX|nr:hypothetical protein SAVMC3_76260 [Streptomyces avermitilis]GDY81881.1 hypothetical protein SAVCW2_10800 [Streptomyces avermitilis]
MIRESAQKAVQAVRRPGRSPGRPAAEPEGRPAPAVATIAVPITEAYQLGPRWRKAAARGRDVRTLGGARGWAAVTMAPRSLRPGDLTREYASMGA